MAFSVAQMYPGAFTADVNFVDGKYKNSSAPGVYDGTPLDNLLFNQNLALFDALMLEAGLTYNNSADIPETSQLHKAMQIGREVSPRNNDWNGYLDPEHQSSLPSAGGYPGNSGGGEVPYTADQEISFGIFAGSGGATVSSDSDGWIFTDSIYKLYDYTTEQLTDIDVTTVPVYLKDQDGVEYFLKHNGTSVIVTKVGSQLKVEITDAIFTGSFTKLWRFFVTERVGRVVELSPEELSNLLSGAGRKDEIINLIIDDSESSIYPSISGEYASTGGTYNTVPSGTTHLVINDGTSSFLVELDTAETGTITAIDATALTATIGGTDVKLWRVKASRKKKYIIADSDYTPFGDLEEVGAEIITTAEITNPLAANRLFRLSTGVFEITDPNTKVRAQVYETSAGEWGDSGWFFGQAAGGGYGVRANIINNVIGITSGSIQCIGIPRFCGSSLTNSGYQNTARVRVIVEIE